MEAKNTDTLITRPGLLRVLYALTLWGIRTRHSKDRSGYMWALIEPMIIIMLFGAAFLFLGAVPPQKMDLFTFLVTGLGSFFVFRLTFTVTMQSLSGARGLLMYPGIMPFHIVLSSGILQSVTMILVFFILLAAGWLLGANVTIHDPFTLVLSLLGLTTLGVGLGAFFSAISQFITLLQKIMPVIVRPMMFFSGAFYTPDEIPKEFLWVFMLNPITHFIEYAREGAFYQYNAKYADFNYVFMFVIVTLFLGVLAHAALKKRILCLDKVG